MADEPQVDTFPDWLDMVRQACTAEVWAAIVTAQAEKAVKGDPKALEFFTQCVLPKEKSDPAEARVKLIKFVLATKDS